MFSCFRVVMPCCFILELLKYTYILITLKSSKIIRWTREGLEGLGRAVGSNCYYSLCVTAVREGSLPRCEPLSLKDRVVSLDWLTSAQTDRSAGVRLPVPWVLQMCLFFNSMFVNTFQWKTLNVGTVRMPMSTVNMALSRLIARDQFRWWFSFHWRIISRLVFLRPRVMGHVLAQGHFLYGEDNSQVLFSDLQIL